MQSLRGDWAVRKYATDRPDTLGRQDVVFVARQQHHVAGLFDRLDVTAY